jgi:uncharacterized protein (TIGR03790 family)
MTRWSLAPCRVLTVLVAFAAAPAVARAQGPENVLLVINASSPDSARVGEHYARARGLDPSQVVRLEVPVLEEISRNDYDTFVQRPVAEWLARHGAQDRILFIVLTKGVPLRVGGSGGRQGTVASVDSELALLYRRMTGQSVAPQGSVANPYFLGPSPLTDAQPFTRERMDIYLVTRLDGFTADDAMALVDRASRPLAEGRIVLDMKAAIDDKGNEWLKTAADRLTSMGKSESVLLQTTSDVVRDLPGVLGYYSWGSNDRAVKVRRFGFQFVPGAVAAMFVSTDARTFKEPPAEWTIGTWNDRNSYFEGSPQSLVGDLIREGVTGVAGHVAEPYLDATIRPEILFPAYLSGYTLAEAYYLAMPYLSWQTVVVGDPLCRLVQRAPLDSTLVNPPVDPETEFPRFYSARRLANLASQPRKKPLDPDVLKLTLKAESRLARQDEAGAEEILAEATRRDPTLTGAQLLLATRYELRGDYDKAAERYRLVLQSESSNVMALNNLAYLIAVRQQKPGDALVLAERAYAVSQRNPTVADTVGWIHYLLGNTREALRYLGEAVKGASNNVDVLVHTAVVLAAAGELEGARKALERATAIDPSVRDRDEVKKVQAQIGGSVARDPGSARRSRP